jgi:hypothetical protein
MVLSVTHIRSALNFRMNQIFISSCYSHIQGDFKAIDAFIDPHFSATGMLSAARCMRVLLMTQHA